MRAYTRVALALSGATVDSALLSALLTAQTTAITGEIKTMTDTLNQRLDAHEARLKALADAETALEAREAANAKASIALTAQRDQLLKDLATSKSALDAAQVALTTANAKLADDEAKLAAQPDVTAALARLQTQSDEIDALTVKLTALDATNAAPIPAPTPTPTPVPTPTPTPAPTLVDPNAPSGTEVVL